MQVNPDAAPEDLPRRFKIGVVNSFPHLSALPYLDSTLWGSLNSWNESGPI